MAEGVADTSGHACMPIIFIIFSEPVISFESENGNSIYNKVLKGLVGTQP